MQIKKTFRRILYDFTEILPQLPPESLILSIPLVGTNLINISVPIHVVKEWQSLI